MIYKALYDDIMAYDKVGIDVDRFEIVSRFQNH